MDSKTLILIRHAHRETRDRSADNGLSDKGKEQAAALAKYFESSSLFEAAVALSSKPRGFRPALMSSPKLRCIETITPIARKLRLEVEALPLLTEQKEGETARAFAGRIDEFTRWWKSEGPSLTIVCSHGDWLPLCVERLVGAQVEFQKGSWAEVGSGGPGERPSLRWLIQNFSDKLKLKKPPG